MARYRKISPKIWNDKDFRSFSDNGKLVFFLLLTHPHTSAIGTIRAFLPGLAPELRWEEKAFREAFQEALNKNMVKVDEKAGLIWLPNFIKYNQPESPNVLRSWTASLEDCPECNLKNEVYQSVEALAKGLGEAFAKAFREAFRLPLPNQEQEQEQDIREDSNESLSTAELPIPDAQPYSTLQETDAADSPSSPDETTSITHESTAKPTPSQDFPDCPHETVIALYHEQLPELPKVRAWNDKRKKNLRARWRDICKRLQDAGHPCDAPAVMAWLKKYFSRVRASPWLMGQISGRDGRIFIADLAWLICPENFAKVIDGKYLSRKVA